MKRLWVLSLLVGFLAFASLCALAALPFFFKHYRVVSDGMAPAISKGDIVVTRRRPYGDIGDVRRGDVVLWQQRKNDATYIMIWRVVGLPGDKLQFNETDVVLNGRALEQTPMPSSSGLRFIERVGDVSYQVVYDRRSDRIPVEATVPQGSLFVVGDNRDHAFDSRFEGSIPFTSIVGRVVWVPALPR
jgi:signal peptidase I